MDEKMHWVPTSIGMVVLAFIFGGISLAIYPGLDVVWLFLVKMWALKWDSAPAWVQAVGSIGAIYFTSRGVRLQLEGQRDQQLQAEARKNTKDAEDSSKEQRNYRIKKNIIIYGAYFQVSQWCKAVCDEYDEGGVDWSAYSAGCRVINDAINKMDIEELPTPFDAINITSVRIHMELIYQALLDAHRVESQNGQVDPKSIMGIIRDFFEKTKLMKIKTLNLVAADASVEEIQQIFKYLKEMDQDIELISRP